MAGHEPVRRPGGLSPRPALGLLPLLAVISIVGVAVLTIAGSSPVSSQPDAERASRGVETECPSFPISASDTETLDVAIACFNEVSTAGAYRIELTSDITLTLATEAIANPIPGVSLTVDGQGNTLDADGNGSVITINNATVTIEDITLTGGAAVDGAGLRILFPSTVAVRGSTITGNAATGDGGGINTDGLNVSVINSTVSGNSAAANGGGIHNGDNGLVVAFSTITDNDAPAGSGLQTSVAAAATTTVEAAIVADNTGGGADIDQLGVGADPYSSGGSNVLGSIGPGVAAFAGPGDLTGQDPRLGPLGNNGGPTPTHALAVQSPAVDRASGPLTNNEVVDQRGLSRPVGLASDAGAFELQLACVDRFPYAAIDGPSLGAAIDCFNAITTAGSYEIDISVDIGLDIAGGGLPTINNASAGVSLFVDGNGFAVDGANATGVFEVLDGEVAFQRITLSGGNSQLGGGLHVAELGVVTVADTTITANTALEGGGIYNDGNLTIVNSTISGNVAADGGGLLNDGAAVVSFSTVTDNDATGIVSRSDLGVTTTVEASIVAGNVGPSDISIGGGTDSFISGGFNVVENIPAGVVAFGGATERTGVDPGLLPLAGNGGPARTHGLVGGSPAVDLVTGAVANDQAFDQRGVARPAGAASDAGAYERELDRLTVLAEPCPLYDSSQATTPGLSGPFAANEIRTIQVSGVVPAGQGGLSSGTCVPTEASAVVYTISVVDPQGPGNLRLSPVGVVPNGGVVNYTANGLNNANTVTVPLPSTGQVDIRANAGATGVRLVAVGYYSAQGTLRYTPVVPCAVADSRAGQSPAGSFLGPFTVGTAYPDVDVVGAVSADQGGGGNDCGVPAQAQAVVVNVVAIRPPGGFGGTGFLAAGPATVNPAEPTTPFADIGLNNATATVISLEGGDSIAIDIEQVSASPSTHIRVVVLGYLDNTGVDYTPVNPCAAFDTRAGQGPSGDFVGLRADQSTTVYTLTGVIPSAQGGAGGDCGVPAGADAVLINLVAIGANAPGNLRAYANGTTPTGGILNFAGLTPPMNNSNAVVVPLSDLGRIDLFVNAPSNGGQPTTHTRGVILGYYN